MKLERHSTTHAAALACADRIEAALRANPEAVLLLPAGNTPVPVFAQLVERAGDDDLDLSRAHLFQLDELVGVPPSDPRSFHAFLREHLLDPLGLAGERVHLLDGAAADPVREIEAHAAALAALGGARLAFLGIGRNGHVAFNEPGSGPKHAARLVELADATLAGLRAQFSPDELPTLGITLGLRELYDAEEVVLLALGRGKAGVVRGLVGNRPVSELPAAAFRDHPSFALVVDFEL